MSVNKKKSFQVKKAINQEYRRNFFAVTNNYKKLIKEYSSKCINIPNHNTSTLWDKKNFESDFSRRNNPIAFDRLRIVNKYLPTKNVRILNIGFGSGNLEKTFTDNKQIGLSVKWSGIDISAKSVAQAKINYPNFSFYLSNIESASFPLNNFDIVIALEVFEHISPTSVFPVLKKIKSFLKPQGKLLISIPINEGLEDMLYKGENLNAHTRIYTPELISSELEINKFIVEKIYRLYAFHKYYYIKKIIVQFLPFLRKPNNIVIMAINEK